MLKIGVVGASGRMGKMIVEVIAKDPHAVLGALIFKKGSTVAEILITDTSKVKVTDNLLDAMADFDTLIDFTLPDATINYLDLCKKNNKKLVIGTTGLSEKQQAMIAMASNQIPIVCASNMSIGINLVAKLVKLAASTLRWNADIDIIDIHHRFKKDAPSGTALFLGEAVASSLDVTFTDSRTEAIGTNGCERPPHKIGFASIRAGNVVGEHKVSFTCEGETVEIIHRANHRNIFAKGALKAAYFLENKNTGLFNMNDVISL